MKRQKLSKEEVSRELNRREALGHHIDLRVTSAIENAEALTLLTLENPDEFLALIWQENDGIRLLTANQSRCLKDIAQIILDNGLTFEHLTSNLGYSEKMHNPSWFAPCYMIDREFDFDAFGWIVVVPATDNERKRCASGSYYIYDGVHKTLVLSKRLLANEEQYIPLSALLLEPRPQ